MGERGIPKVVISAETNNGVAELAHYSIHQMVS